MDFELAEIMENLYWNTEWSNFSDTEGAYGSFYKHLKAVLLAGVVRVREGQAVPPFSQGYLDAFVTRMRKITMRALIFEMELCADCGELAGETDEEKYRFFTENFLNNQEKVKEIYTEYPLMYQDMLRCLVFSVRNVQEALERFEQDREELEKRFFAGKDCGEIKEIDGGDSDSHNGGRTVLILTLESGERIVYKPRSLAVEERYRSFLLWVCEKIGMPYWWNQVWDRGEYGWCGWAEGRPCESYEELKRYYQRNGILLCISYLLESEDLHYENLIACGEFPVIVDLEMGIGSRGVKPYAEAWSEPQRLFWESVLQTGILPMYAWNAEGEGVNVGAVSGAGGQLAPLEIPVVVNPGTVRMRVEYRQPVMKEGKNLATLKGRFIQPYEFVSDMIEGFEKAYCFLAGEKDRTREQLAGFCNGKVRCLLRQTQEYSMVLTLMHHPDFLTGEREREELLKQGGFGGDGVRKAEAEALRQGDIPYFWYMPGETDLYSGEIECCSNFFDFPVMECINRLLQRMNSMDLERQKKLIYTALWLGAKSGERVQKEKVPAGSAGRKETADVKAEASEDDRNWEQVGELAAERIGRLLLGEAIWSEDRTDVGWISIVMVGYRERGYLIRPMGLYLYDGLAGVAVFLQRLGQKTGEKIYQDVAGLLIKKLFTHTMECSSALEMGKLNEVAEESATGAFTGEASIAYAYMLLYSATGEKGFLEHLYKQCFIVAGMLSQDKNYDVLAGNAGAVLVLLCAYELTGDSQYIEWARKAGDTLLEKATPYEWGLGWVSSVTGTALTGFAHGAAGIMLALAKLYYYTGDIRYLQGAKGAFLYEEHYYDEEKQDWKDLRFPGQEESGHEMAWCHGWGGIVMARRAAEKYVDGDFREMLRSITDKMEKKRQEGWLKESYCLCHGNCGNVAILSMLELEADAEGGEAHEQEQKSLKKVFKRKLVWKDFKNISKEILAKLCSCEDIRELLEIQECSNYGFMAGITGIGYSCLCGMEECGNVLQVDIFAELYT